jgi:hypothetical protein
VNSSFLSKLVLTDKTVHFNELKVKHYKTILKSILGDDIDYEIAITNINNIIKCISDLTINEIRELNFLDYFLLLFEIRCTSISSFIVAETTDDVATKIDINVLKFIEHVKKIDINSLLLADNVNNFTIHYRLPTLKEISTIDINNIESLYSIFVKTITFKNIDIHFTNLSFIETIQILEKLPANITSSITKRAQHIITTFNRINLISHIPGIGDRQLFFNLNIRNLENLLKLLFGEPLLSLYENIFSLSKIGNISPNYIEECTPGEYHLFVKRLELSQQTNNSNDSLPQDDGVDPFEDEYMPEITSRSEFTP